MNAYESSGQETSDCIGLKTTVCPNGVINVKRPQSDRAHSTFVDGDGDVIRCSCKGYKYNGHCVHQDEIAKRPLVRSSAAAAAAETSQQVATDGGIRQVAPTDETDTETDDRQTDDSDDKRPQTDHWGNAVEHYDDGPVGAGEKSECQSCGARFEVALIAATEESSNRNWEEFYRCEACGARGSFRFYGETDRREWTGRIAYPEDSR
jgi:DNA-directed RNA polymerase subunit M/transcription elongation factor TFIIS